MRGDPDRTYMFVYTTMQHPSDKVKGQSTNSLEELSRPSWVGGDGAICRQPQLRLPEIGMPLSDPEGLL